MGSTPGLAPRAAASGISAGTSPAAAVSMEMVALVRVRVEHLAGRGGDAPGGALPGEGARFRVSSCRVA
eukprot:318224-Lingulodinium_polyedra.AAC.1